MCRSSDSLLSQASQVAEYEEKTNFVKSCPLFNGWSTKFKGLLEMSLRKEVYPYGAVIVQQGAPVTGLIFILSGQAKLTMEPAKHTVQFTNIMKKRDVLPSTNKKIHVSAKDVPHERRHKESVRAPQVSVRRKLGYAAAERRLMSRSVDVCCVEKDEVIGETEMVLDLPTNSETVTSTAHTTVLVLNTKNYERLVTKKHAFTVTRLLHSALGKVSTRAHSSKGALVPLLKHLERELRDRVPKPPPPAKKVEILQKQEVVMNQLVDLFLQDKAPMIEPCVPNSLFYRQKSAKKNKVLMKNPYAELRTLKHIDDFGKIRRKMPRSVMQLKNNVQAERELLGQQGRGVLDTDYDDEVAGISRPMTSLGFSTKSPRSRISRPSTSLRITECRQENDRYSNSENHPDRRNRLGYDEVAEIFEEMELINRENQSNRMKLICSVSAKNELKEKLDYSKSPGNDKLDDFQELFDAEYFDWETSENNLRDLETRVDDFCRSVTPGVLSNDSNNASSTPTKQLRSRPVSAISEMKRFEIEDPSLVPLPGGTVYVHKKACRFSRSDKSSASPELHRHVRRFMLSRQPELWGNKGRTPAATDITY